MMDREEIERLRRIAKMTLEANASPTITHEALMVGQATRAPELASALLSLIERFEGDWPAASAFLRYKSGLVFLGADQAVYVMPNGEKPLRVT